MAEKGSHIVAKLAQGIVDRPHVSPWLLWTAEHQAALARLIEQARPDGRRHPWIEHRAYVLSSIAAAAAFLEAVINELFQDVEDQSRDAMTPGDPLSDVTRHLPARMRSAMSMYWVNTRAGLAPTLEKYQRLLQFGGAPPINPRTWADAALLIDIRNAILHYRPRDNFTARQAHTFETELKKRRITANPISGSDRRAYWPERALSSDLAFWTIGAAMTLTDQACAAVGVDPSYARHKRGSWFDQAPGTSEA